jgi:abortive infection protein abiGII
MKTSEQIKGAIRNISKKTGVNPNSLLQMCLFEGVLEKLSKSKYSKNFILKGGLLISSLIGIDMRSTMDMDTTIKGIPVNEKTISKKEISVKSFCRFMQISRSSYYKYYRNSYLD